MGATAHEHHTRHRRIFPIGISASSSVSVASVSALFSHAATPASHATISTHGHSSASPAARRASVSTASGDAPRASSHGRGVTRRSPSKKPPPSSAPQASPAVVTAAQPDAAEESPSAVAQFNPLVAMQTVLAGDMVSIKQRAKAAQQLATYFCELPTTPSLYVYYEPYLPIVASVITAPIKAAKEVQDNARKMLKALGSHSARQFVDWCALHVSMNPTQEPWYVDWCCGLLLAAETRVPRVHGLVQTTGQRGEPSTVEVWDERSLEYQELDAATAAVFHLWRAVLDNADDEELVYEIAVNMKMLLCYHPTASDLLWRATVSSKIQPHFVDVADVLIGWAMGSTTSSRLRNAIFELLEDMRELWIGNSVFCFQLLESFSRDIAAIYATPITAAEDEIRLDSIVRCSILIAQCVPMITLGNGSGSLRFAENLLRPRAPARFIYSSVTVLRLSEYLEAIGTAHSEEVAPLGMSSIRFLLVQAASMVARRQCEAHDCILILERASCLARTYLSTRATDSSVLLEASSLIKDEVSADGAGRTGSVLELLLSVKHVGAVKYTTQITVQAIALLGLEGLRLVAGVMDHQMKITQKPSHGYWSTCFILASRDPRMAELLHHFGILRKTSSVIQSVLKTATLIESTPTLRQGLCASGVLKLAPAFVTLLRKHGSAPFDSTTSELLLQQVQLCIHVGSSPSSSSDLSQQETFRALAWAISAYPMKTTLPVEVLSAIVAHVESAVWHNGELVPAECAALLAAVSPRVNGELCGRIFQLAVTLADCSESMVVKKILPGLSLVALNASSHLQPSLKAQTPSLKDMWTPSGMTVGDFELVISLLSQPESTRETWYRTCRRIQGRLRHTNPSCGHRQIALVKQTVCEAAKWVIQARLRSPLGPPSAIFSSVEKMLLSHASFQRSASRSSHSSRISAAMLLEFVLAIETGLGVVTDLKCPDTNPESEQAKVQGFFRANVGVCEEWLSRIRPTLIELSSRLNQAEAGIHHRFAIVANLSRKLDVLLQRQGAAVATNDARVRMMKQIVELETSLFHLTEDLCDMGDSDAIVGLQHWWTELLSRAAHFLGLSSASTVSIWLQAITLEAEMKYEDATKCFETVVSHVISSQHAQGDRVEAIMHPLASVGVSLSTFVGCVRRCGRSYVSLRDWRALQDLHSRCWWFAESIAADSDGDQAFAELVELCSVWKAESVMVAALLTSDQMTRHSSMFHPTPLVDSHSAALASTALETWGALNPIDASSFADSFHLDVLANEEKTSQIVDRVRLLQFRPSGIFSDSLSQSCREELKSIVIDTSLINGITFQGKVEAFNKEISVIDIDGSTVDPTQWARLYYASTPECRNLSPNAGVWWLAMARAARKNKNYRFAHLLLNELRQQSIERHPSVCDTALSYEDAVLKMSGEAPRDGVLTLIKLCDSVLHVRDDSEPNVAPDTVHVQSLLRLARTLATVDTGDQFASVEAAMSIMGSRVDQGDEAGLVGYRDALVKVCLESATEIMPSNSRTWYEYSRWCHQQGRARLDKLLSNHGVAELTPAEETDFSSLVAELRKIGSTVDEVDLRDAVCRMMEDGSLLSNREERVRSELYRVLPADDNHDNLVDSFVSLQTRIVSRLLLPLKLAVKGYRSFLLAAASSNDTHHNSRLSSRITSVALRLLRMLTRFGSEQEVVTIVTDLLANGPLVPWGRIVPQLLSRIGHSYETVSAPVTALLVRLARQYPHLVVYPAIVEAGRRQQGELPGVKLINEVVSELRSNAPDLTDTIERVVEELKRISVLWDDAWIGALMKMSGDVSRRIGTLEKEAQRVEKNSSLSIEEKNQLARRKAIAIMKPVLVAVERLAADTIDRAASARTLTPHEKQFFIKYGTTISAALRTFRAYCNPVSVPSDWADAPTCAALTSPASVWQPFAELLKTLLAAVGRRERVDLVEISPSLARISHKNKYVLMPGSFSSENLDSSQTVTVNDVSRTVSILRSKTKPKCLKFVGSDGQSHRYLLKAREDLHLDERMMQFLDTVNGFLRADRASNSRNLLGRNYSVVPLSSDAGLIQMVPDVLPLFQIYTSRVEDVGAIIHGLPLPTDGEQIALPQQQPPTAPFYAKLKQYGIQDVAPSQRSRWPKAILRRVYEDLVAGRPANVVQRELALQSDNFADAWAKQYRFSRSTAVMSVLGYIMGLGDRHLDNMLLCTETGELLHIDYNVCFDKGRKLKVPEIVPFRLTPIILDAMGLTGVEGVFRSAFTNTLRVVRDADSREALLALLEAFVYDPLIDWVGDGKHHAISKDTKQRMDVNVNLSLFLSRAREREQDTVAFKERFTSTSNTVVTSLRQFWEWLGPEVLAQCERQSRAVETKVIADEALSVVEREWAAAMVIHPEEQVEIDFLQAKIESDKSTLAAFAAECLSRHEQVHNMVKRIAGAAIADPRDTLSGLSAAESLYRAHARIVSVTRQLPLSASSPVWRSMLASLEARCVSLDQQIPAVLDQTSHIIRELALVLHVYKTQRCGQLQVGDGMKVDDMYGRWYGRCTEVISLLSHSNQVNRRATSEAMTSILSRRPLPTCSRTLHEQAINELSDQIEEVKAGVRMDERIGEGAAEMDSGVQQFFDRLAAMKLSNSQTQRVIKLICVQWVVSSLIRVDTLTEDKVVSLREYAVVKGLRKTLGGVFILRNMVSCTRGAMKKTLVELLSRQPDELVQQDSTQITIGSVLSILQSLESLTMIIAETVSQSQYGVGREMSDNDGSASISSTFQAVSSDLTRLEQALRDLRLDVDSTSLASSLDSVRADIGHFIQGNATSCDWKSTVLPMIRELISGSLQPIANAVVRHVVTGEWKVDADVFEAGSSFVEKLALEAMPALGTNQCVSDFRACCELLTMVGSEWTQQSIRKVCAGDRQRYVSTLTRLRREHQRHLAISSWQESGQGDELLTRIGRLTPRFPMMFEETSRIESSLLEVAQQLEYVASQVSFSCSLEFPAHEVELHAVCKDVQESYNQIARQFEIVRAMSEMAIGINAVEASLESVCGAEVVNDNGTPPADHEVDQVGRSILQTACTHVQRLVEIQDGSNDSTVVLKQQLDAARQNVSQAQLDVVTSSETWERTSESLSVHYADTLKRLHQVLKPVSVMNQMLRSLGLPSNPESDASPTERSTSSFVLSENERLVKILLRSVESTTFMHSLHEVLMDYEKQHQEMLRTASILGMAFTKFLQSARVALDGDNASEAIHAIQELLHATNAVEFDRVEGLRDDLCSKVDGLLQLCCKSFFTAADLADELTKVEEECVDEVVEADTHPEIDGDLLGDDENPENSSNDDSPLVNVPLRPIAGFQEQNAYGMEVVARIEEKLSGVVVDCGSSDPLSIDDQSAWLIRSATSVDNLCVMYEGWTPWI